MIVEGRVEDLDLLDKFVDFSRFAKVEMGWLLDPLFEHFHNNGFLLGELKVLLCQVYEGASLPPDACLAKLNQAQQLCSRINDHHKTAECYIVAGDWQMMSGGDINAPLDTFNISLRYSEACGDLPLQALAHALRGNVHEYHRIYFNKPHDETLSSPELAILEYNEALRIFSQLNDQEHRVHCLLKMGFLYWDLDSYHNAKTMFRWARRVAHANKNVPAVIDWCSQLVADVDKTQRVQSARGQIH